MFIVYFFHIPQDFNALIVAKGSANQAEKKCPLKKRNSQNCLSGQRTSLKAQQRDGKTQLLGKEGLRVPLSH